MSVLCPQAVRTAILSKRRDKDRDEREEKALAKIIGRQWQ